MLHGRASVFLGDPLEAHDFVAEVLLHTGGEAEFSLDRRQLRANVFVARRHVFGFEQFELCRLKFATSAKLASVLEPVLNQGCAALIRDCALGFLRVLVGRNCSARHGCATA